MKENTKVMYAGFWLRFLAYIVDIAIVAAVTAAILRPIFIQLSLPISSATLSLYGIVSLTLFLLYFILMTKLTNGQTLGKMIFGLRVISLDENKISWKTIIFREGVCRYFLQAFPLGILYVVAAFTGKKQGIGDLLCDTFVVKDEVYELINHFTSEQTSHENAQSEVEKTSNEIGEIEAQNTGFGMVEDGRAPGGIAEDGGAPSGMARDSLQESVMPGSETIETNALEGDASKATVTAEVDADISIK